MSVCEKVQFIKLSSNGWKKSSSTTDNQEWCVYDIKKLRKNDVDGFV